VSLARLLVIAGSDCSAGAGLQADLKTAQAFGVYAQTAVTAVTVQNTDGVSEVQAIPAEIVRAQIEACLSDIGADAIKIGMLCNGMIAAAVADALEGSDIPLVLDTVMLSSSGAALLDQAGVEILKFRLIPRARLVTPNVPEAESLLGISPMNDHSVRDAAIAFSQLTSAHVLFKGGHVPPSDKDNGLVRDTLFGEGKFAFFEASRQPARHTHGTGCTLATAIACGLAKGQPLLTAITDAHSYVQHAIRNAPGLGHGNGPLHH
jgi:hydroxymethylpyrimidine/phosphomethylpyrimidine kinase